MFSATPYGELGSTTPHDLDIAIMINDSDVSQVRQTILKKYKLDFTDSNGVLISTKYEKAVATLEDLIKKGKIPQRQFGKQPSVGLLKERISFSQELYLRNIYPNGQQINISIIIDNGLYDLGPYLKF